MPIMKAWSSLHQNKAVQFLQILIATVIIVDYAVFDTIEDFAGGWFYLLPALVILAALLVPVRDTMSRSLKVPLTLIHYGLVAMLLVFFTDIFGPYFQLLVLILLGSVLWFGLRGMIYGLLVSYVIIWIALSQQAVDGIEAFYFQAGLYVVSLSILGVLFERVTQRHRQEIKQQSQASQNYYLERTRLLSLINSMADAVIATTSDGEISLYNGSVLSLLNTNQSLQGKNIQDLLKLMDSNDNEVDILARSRKEHAPIVDDNLHFQAPDGSRVDLYVNISPVSSPGSDREITGFIIVLRDITKQKTLDEQRDEFISVASHELRTPIAIAEANISTAMLPKYSHKLTQEGRKLLEQAHDNVLFLGSLINDLHVLAQAEQGSMGITLSSLDPAKFLQEMADNYHHQIKAKGLDLKVEVADNLEPFLTSKDALREVLQNLITNAIKYTQEGSITLRAEYDEQSNEVVFSVSDTGIGISESDKKRVFEKFYRSEDYRTRQNGGTGLGLYIIKRLIERLGGRIWLESRLNKGSTFYCALPFKQK